MASLAALCRPLPPIPTGQRSYALFITLLIHNNSLFKYLFLKIYVKMIKIGPLIKIFEFISKCKGHYSAKIPIVCTDKPIKHINTSNQICETDKMTDINLHATLMQ